MYYKAYGFSRNTLQEALRTTGVAPTEITVFDRDWGCWGGLSQGNIHSQNVINSIKFFPSRNNNNAGWMALGETLTENIMERMADAMFGNWCEYEVGTETEGACTGELYIMIKNIRDFPRAFVMNHLFALRTFCDYGGIKECTAALLKFFPQASLRGIIFASTVSYQGRPAMGNPHYSFTVNDSGGSFRGTRVDAMKAAISDEVLPSFFDSYDAAFSEGGGYSTGSGNKINDVWYHNRRLSGNEATLDISINSGRMTLEQYINECRKIFE